MTFNVGAVTVDIVPNAAGFQAKVDAAVRNAKIKVTADFDANGLSSKIKNAARDTKVKVEAEFDGDGVKAKIKEATQDAKVKVGIDVDDVEAKAKIKEATHDTKVGVDLHITNLREFTRDLVIIRSEVQRFLADTTFNVEPQLDQPSLEEVRAGLRAITTGVSTEVAVRLNRTSYGEVNSELRAIESGRTADLAVIIEGEVVAEEKLDHLARDRKVELKVDTDDAGATAKKDDDKLKALAGSAGLASGAIAAMVAVGAGIGPAIIPAAAAAAGAVAAIAPAALIGAGGLAVLVGGLSGVFSAVSALTKAQNANAISGAQNARAQKAAADQVKSAQAGVASAEASLANTRANAVEGARRAAQAVVNAQQAVKDATQQAAQNVATAIAREATAERSLSDALRNEQDAQKSLSAARQQAKRDIEDLNNAVQDGALSQRQAALDVQSAYDALVQAQDSGSVTERQQAQLNYDQATQRQREAAEAQARLRDQQKTSKAQGVEGSPQVVAAKRALEDARRGVADARRSVVEAQKAITAARVAGNRAIAKAEQDLSDAEHARAEQRRQSAFSVAQAEQSVVNAQRSLKDAQDKATESTSANADALARAREQIKQLTPEGQKLAAFLSDVLIPRFRDLRDAAQARLSSGLLDGLRVAAPIAKPITSLVKNLADALGDLFRKAGQALGSPFWTQFVQFLSDNAGPVFSAFGDILGDLLTGFAGIAEAFAPVGKKIGGSLQDLSQRFRDFGTGKGDGLSKFVKYVEDEGPKVAETIGSIFSAVGHLIEALAPLGGRILDAVDRFSDKIANIPTDTLGKVASTVLAIIAAVSGMVSVVSVVSAVVTVFQFLTSIVGAAIGGVGLIAIGFVILYTKVKPFHDFVNNKVVPALRRLYHDGLVGIQRGLLFVTGAINLNRPVLHQMHEDFKKFVDFANKYIVPALGFIIKVGFIGLGYAIGIFITVLSTLYSSARFVLGEIVKFWKTMYTSLVGGYNLFIKPMIEIFMDLIKGDFVGAFKTGVEAVGKIWDGLKELAKAPIKFVVNTVLEDGLLRGFRAISGLVGFDRGKNFHLTKMSTGGVLPGYTPGRDVHRFVSPTAGVLDLSGGEGILRPELVRAMGPSRIDQANAAARSGRADDGLRYLGGYAEGGTLRLYRPVRGRVTQGIHDVSTGFPAIDFGVPVGTPVAAAAAGRVSRSQDLRGYEPRIRNQNGYKSYGKVIQIISQGFQTLYAHLSQRSVKVGQQVAGGQIIGLSGNTGHSFGPHLHFGARGISPNRFLSGSSKYSGSSGNGTAGNPVAGDGGAPLIDYNGELAKKFAGPLSKLGGLGTSLWAQMAKAGTHALARLLTGRMRKLAATHLDDTEGDVKVAGSKAAGKWLPEVLHALKLVGLPSSLADNWIRQIASESGGNPNAIQGNIGDVNNRSGDLAKGLVQVIGATFRAYRSHSLPNNVFNPLSNLYAGMNYARDRYGARNLESVIGHGHGYDNGGWLQPGTTVVHNNTGKPEPVFNPGQWKTLEALVANGRSSGPMIHVDKIETADARGVAAEIESRWMLREALYPSW